MNDKARTTTWDQKLFVVLWIWVCFRTLLPWLVFFRLTFEGNSYRWGTSYFGHSFHSSGLDRADFMLVYALLASGLLILFFLREFRFNVAAPLMVGLLATHAADAFFELVAGDPVIFQGDTLGIRMNISAPFFALSFAMFALAIAWWMGVRNVAAKRNVSRLTPARKRIVQACVLAVPLQLTLLMSGEPHGTTDQLGVILTILQGGLLSLALYPGNAYRHT